MLFEFWLHKNIWFWGNSLLVTNTDLARVTASYLFRGWTAWEIGDKNTTGDTKDDNDTIKLFLRQGNWLWGTG